MESKEIRLWITGLNTLLEINEERDDIMLITSWKLELGAPLFILMFRHLSKSAGAHGKLSGCRERL
jgi:hypothetical protein